VTNLTCTLCALFSRLFLQICRFALSLYTVGQLVTLPSEISVQSPVVCVNSRYRVRVKSMACVHTVNKVNRIMPFRDMAVWTPLKNHALIWYRSGHMTFAENWNAMGRFWLSSGVNYSSIISQRKKRTTKVTSYKKWWCCPLPDKMSSIAQKRICRAVGYSQYKRPPNVCMSVHAGTTQCWLWTWRYP